MSRFLYSRIRATVLWSAAFVLCLGTEALWAGSDKPSKALDLELQSAPPGAVCSVAVSPDGSLVAAAGDVGGIRLYDAKTGAFVREFGEVGRSVVFSPDGRLIAAAGFNMDKMVRIFDVQTGKIVHRLAGHTVLESYGTAFSPDGKLFASAGREDQQILVWDLATGELRHQLTDQNFGPTAIAFSPDSSTLASGGGDRLVRLWDMKSGKVRTTLKGHRDWICTIAYSADGKTIASGCCDFAYHRGRDPSRFEWGDPAVDSEWKTWDAATGTLKRTVTEPGRMLGLALAPDGNLLACGLGKEVRVYDLQKETPGRVVARHAGLVTSVAFTRDSSAVISGSHDQTTQRVNLADGKLAWQLPGYFEQINSVAMSQDGSRLVTGTSDERFAKRGLKSGDKVLGPGAVRVWDAHTGKLLRRLGDPKEQVMAVALSPDGQRVVSGGASPDGNGIVRVWETASGKPGWSASDHSAEVLAVAYAPDASSVATADADGVIQLRDASTGAALRTMPGHAGARPRWCSPRTARG